MEIRIKKKDSPSTAADEESSLVAGVVLLAAAGSSRVRFRGALLKETLSRYAPTVLFYSSAFNQA